MTSASSSFQYTNDRPTAGDSTLFVRIPAGLNRKRRLLTEYARQLSLPDYFGWNWDAFEECLRDLTWLEGVRTVVIVHRDVPFDHAPEQQAIYLSILKDRLAWDHPQSPRVQVIFPRSAEQTVNWVLGENNG